MRDKVNRGIESLKSQSCDGTEMNDLSSIDENGTEAVDFTSDIEEVG